MKLLCNICFFKTCFFDEYLFFLFLTDFAFGICMKTLKMFDGTDGMIVVLIWCEISCGNWLCRPLHTPEGLFLTLLLKLL